MEEGGPTFIGGVQLFPEGIGPFAYSYIDLVIFQGVGPDPPGPSSESARGIVNWVRPHIVLATRHSMTLTLLMYGYYATGSYCCVSDWRYAWGIRG